MQKMRIFDRSVYNGKTGGLQDINPNFAVSVGGIKGTLVEPPDISIPASWSPLINIDDRIGSLNKFARLAGFNLFQVGAFTTKFFEKGDYLKLDIKMKSVNWDGKESVIEKAKSLFKLVSPRGFYSSGTATNKITQSYKRSERQQNKSDEPVQGNAMEGDVTVATKIQNGAARIGNEIKNALLSNVAGSPPVVTVKIGKYISSPNMVIDNVSVNNSKELLKNGEPISAEFSITASSRRILTVNQLNSIFIVNPNNE